MCKKRHRTFHAIFNFSFTKVKQSCGVGKGERLDDFSKVTQLAKDPGCPAFGPVTFPHSPERRKRRSWGCKDVEEPKGRRGRAKSGGVRPAEARAKEGHMDRRAAPLAGVRKTEAVAGERGSRGRVRVRGGRPEPAAGAREAEAPAAGGGGEAESGSGGGRGGSFPHRRGGRVGAGRAEGTGRGGQDPTGWGGGAGLAGGGSCWVPRGSGGGSSSGGAGAVPASSRLAERVEAAARLRSRVAADAAAAVAKPPRPPSAASG